MARREQRGFRVNLQKLGAGGGRLTLLGDSEADPRARERVRKGMDRLIEGGRLRIVVDASALEWLTVDVVGAITGDFLRLCEAGGGLAFAALQPDVEAHLDELGVLGFALPHATVDDAATALRYRAREDAAPLRPERLQLVASTAPDGTTRVVTAIGSLDATGALALEQVVDAELAAGATQLVIDGQRLLDADPAGIATLVKLAERAKRRKKARLHFATLWGVVGAQVDALGLRTTLRTFDSAGEALLAFDDGR